MARTRRFHLYVIHVEILSEKKLPNMFNLEQLHRMLTEGECSGRFLKTGLHSVVGGAAMAELLIEQGSDPGLFQLDVRGNDLVNDSESVQPPAGGS